MEINERKGFTTYTLRVKYNMSSGTVQRLTKGESVTTNTLDCELHNIAEFVNVKA